MTLVFQTLELGCLYGINSIFINFYFFSFFGLFRCVVVKKKFLKNKKYYINIFLIKKQLLFAFALYYNDYDDLIEKNLLDN